jgi:hypothetical protein
MFALDLMSAYEGEHMIFGQANLTQNNVLQFHPFVALNTEKLMQIL